MADSAGRQNGRARLARDNQQWVLDYLIKETGKTFHFEGDARGNLPRSVKSHAMISKHLGLAARKLEALAKVEAEAGHRETAVDLYYKAAMDYSRAQHVVFQLNDEKRYLHAGALRCYGQVRALAPYKIEHVDIPWNGTLVSGYLHLCPDKDQAPLIFHIPGCDNTKENWPHPLFNFAHQRGMHLFCFDGPGQGESNMRGIKLTSNNYEQAASAALDYLLQRPEVEDGQVALYGLSFGSFWGLRFASYDHRLKAVVTPAASYVDKHFLMNVETPRWKQLFAFLTQAQSEAELDAVTSEMTMDGYMGKISCPTLLMAGEYDPRSPLEEIYRMFDQLTAPAELWVFADQFHGPQIGGGEAATAWSAPLHAVVMDWLRDRLQRKPVAWPGQVVYVEPGSSGPNNPKAALKRRWYEDVKREV